MTRDDWKTVDTLASNVKALTSAMVASGRTDEDVAEALKHVLARMTSYLDGRPIHPSVYGTRSDL